MTNFSVICDSISQNLKKPFKLIRQSSVSGGCINQCFRLHGEDSSTFFLKQNRLSFLPFFKSEAFALKEIKETNTIRVPEVVAFGKTIDSSFLVLEFIEEGSSTKVSQKILGTQLANMHKIKKAYFGWEYDNCIGATEQPNPSTKDWVSFFRDSRLSHQFELAKKKGVSFEGKEMLLAQMDSFFQDYTPYPSLLHGDLWGGNFGYTQNGIPFIFDPASYYGDRETDLAFTYMFGGFNSSFYQAYEECLPITSGFSNRKILYNLYHELNHFNLFGGGYAQSAQSSINQLIKLLP